MAVAITVECHWIFRTRGKFSLKYQSPAVARRKWLTWRMFMLTANESILRAARKSDEMLEPYEWKRSCTVLRRERASNRPDLADYAPLVEAMGDIGTVIRVAAGGKDRLNAMYMVDGYGENNPIVVKSQFIMSLVERIDEKGVGDRKSVV